MFLASGGLPGDGVLLEALECVASGSEAEAGRGDRAIRNVGLGLGRGSGSGRGVALRAVRSSHGTPELLQRLPFMDGGGAPWQSR
jgi:hypothetical protein